jgi:Transport and Golgi organisation 2
LCTLVWLSRSDGLTLWHSRDERRSRGVAIPPVVEYANGVAWISPRDSDSGGTWVGVNTHGIVVGLANLFVGTEPVPPTRKVSRGLLVRDLLDSPSAFQVERRLKAMELFPFEPFTLVALEVGQPPVILRWDRTALVPVAPLGPALLVTSAGGVRAIEEGRARLFAAEDGRPLSAERVEELYRAPPGSETAAVCVHRPEVSTVSLTRIDVTSRQISLSYTPGQPCQTPAGPTIFLDRTPVR